MQKHFIIFILVLLSNFATAQVSKTLYVPTAGTLTTLLSSTEKTTVTNLTLTGNIDAHDVKCMRDEMTALEALDISGANINAYVGSEGTDYGLVSYPANEMPKRSFQIGLAGLDENKIIKAINLPNSITSIGYFALCNCTMITDITIPNSVTLIDAKSFGYCKGLKIVRVLNNIPPTLGTDCFIGVNLTVIYVPKGSLATYKSAVGWSAYSSIILEDITSDINEFKGENTKISIFPNPIKNEFKIEFEGGSTFEILNLTGQVIYSGNLSKSSIVQTTDFSAGIYLIRFKIGKSFEYKKIIKE
jgi:hypothetical protein